MSNKEVYSLSEILRLSQSFQSVNASIANERQFLLRTKLGTTLGLQDADKIERIVDYVEGNCNTKLHLVGGGYGCFKIVFEVDGPEDAVELAKRLAKDPEFVKLAKEAGIDLLVTVNKKIPLLSSDSNAASTQSSENGGTNKRVSKDGTTQDIKGE